MGEAWFNRSTKGKREFREETEFETKFRKSIFYLAELADSRNAGTWPLHNKFFAGDVELLRVFNSKHIITQLLKFKCHVGKEDFIVT